jgi:hypothetical protein
VCAAQAEQVAVFTVELCPKIVIEPIGQTPILFLKLLKSAPCIVVAAHDSILSWTMPLFFIALVDFLPTPGVYRIEFMADHSYRFAVVQSRLSSSGNRCNVHSGV